MSDHTQWTRDRISAAVVVNESGCWLYQGYVDAFGYGQIKYRGRSGKAHRVAYTVFRGPIPDGLDLDHVCHTESDDCAGGPTCLHRSCVNPDHLEPVTRGENVNRAKNAARKRTHCPRGHPYDAANTYVNRQGHRVCRECQRAAQRARCRPAAA